MIKKTTSVAVIELIDKKEQYWHAIIQKKSYNIYFDPDQDQSLLKEKTTLLAKIEPYKNTFKAKIIRILHQAKIATFLIKNGNAYDYYRHEKKFTIDKKQHIYWQEDDIVKASVTNNAISIVEIIGNKNHEKTITLLSAYEKNIPIHFTDTLIQEAKEIASKKDHNASRKNLQHLNFVTIDGEDAKDFDDAVYAQQNNDGSIDAYVAIADVSFYITPHSSLDKEAAKRGNSVYLPGHVIPMLPAIISDDVCSLKPLEVRHAVVVHFTIHQHHPLELKSIERAKIISKARLSYNEIQNWHDQKSVKHPFHKDLQNLWQGYLMLQKKSYKRGKLNLSIEERCAVFDQEKNMTTHISYRTHLAAHQLIEEYMIATNHLVAKFAYDKKLSFIHRYHEEPDNMALETLKKYLNDLGYPLNKTVIDKQHLQQVIRKSEKNHEQKNICYEILKAQKSAVYHAHDKGHYALALEYYGHFTSPIRRYADIENHRSIVHFIEKNDRYQPCHDNIPQHLSQTERTAMEIERKSLDRIGGILLQPYIGKVLTGYIKNIIEKGIFVRIQNVAVDGFLSYKSLPHDYYYFIAEKQAAIGKKGLYFEKDMEIKFVLTNINTALSHIDITYKDGGKLLTGKAIKKLIPKKSIRHTAKFSKQKKYR